MIYEGWKPTPEEGVTVFLQGLEERGDHNLRKRIYFSALKPFPWVALYLFAVAAWPPHDGVRRAKRLNLSHGLFRRRCPPAAGSQRDRLAHRLHARVRRRVTAQFEKADRAQEARANCPEKVLKDAINESERAGQLG